MLLEMVGIVAITIGSLIGGAGLIATIRAILGRISPPWVSADVAIAEERAAAEWWPHRSLVALDIFINVVVLRGQQDETISTHAWRAFLEGKLWGKLMTGWLCWIQPNHGQQAASGDLERAQVRVAILSELLE